MGRKQIASWLLAFMAMATVATVAAATVAMTPEQTAVIAVRKTQAEQAQAVQRLEQKIRDNAAEIAKARSAAKQMAADKTARFRAKGALIAALVASGAKDLAKATSYVAQQLANGDWSAAEQAEYFNILQAYQKTLQAERDAMATRVDTLETAVAGIQGVLEGHVLLTQEEYNALMARLTALEEKEAAHEVRLDALEAFKTNFSERVTQLEATQPSRENLKEQIQAVFADMFVATLKEATDGENTVVTECRAALATALAPYAKQEDVDARMKSTLRLVDAALAFVDPAGWGDNENLTAARNAIRVAAGMEPLKKKTEGNTPLQRERQKPGGAR